MWRTVLIVDCVVRAECIGPLIRIQTTRNSNHFEMCSRRSSHITAKNIRRSMSTSSTNSLIDCFVFFDCTKFVTGVDVEWLGPSFQFEFVCWMEWNRQSVDYKIVSHKMEMIIYWELHNAPDAHGDVAANNKFYMTIIRIHSVHTN